MKRFVIILCMFFVQWTFACSCIYIDEPCDYLTNEYNTPVLLKVNRTVGTQIAYVTVSHLTNENPPIQKDYVIVADSITSCGISIDHLEEGEAYFFGLPLSSLDQDAVQYSQCMSPFYEFRQFSELTFCSSSIAVKDIAISPNPIQDRSILIQSELIEPTGFQIYDTSGRLIFESDNLDMNGSKIDLPKTLTNGLYIIRIQSGNNLIVYTSKFMVSTW